jgi:hypothetical protein
MYAGLKRSLGLAPLGGRTCLHGAWNSYAQYVPIGFRLLGRWIRRTAPFREAWVLTPLMPNPCMHGLADYGPSAFTAGLLGLPAGVHEMMSIKGEC